MDKFEAALCIRDLVITGGGTGTFQQERNCRPLIITTLSWEAFLHTPFNPPFRLLPAGKGPQRPASLFAQSELPYRLELALIGGPQVMRCAWSEDEFRLFSLRRGVWENYFFGVPLSGRIARPASWERRLPPPKYVFEPVEYEAKGREPWYFLSE